MYFNIKEDPNQNEEEFILINNKIQVCTDCACSLHFCEINQINNIEEGDFVVESNNNIKEIAYILESYVSYVKYEVFSTAGMYWLMSSHVKFQKEDEELEIKLDWEASSTYGFIWNIKQIEDNEKVTSHAANVIDSEPVIEYYTESEDESETE